MHTKTSSILQEQLFDYDFKINHVQGANNSAAEARTRNISDRTDRFLMSMSYNSVDVIAEQKLDPFIMDVRDYLLKKKSPGGSPGYVLRVAKTAFFKRGLGAPCIALSQLYEAFGD